MSGFNERISYEDLIAYGELSLAQETYRYYTGDVVPLRDVKIMERTKENPNGEFIRTRISKTKIPNEYLIEINKEEEAWHYPWDESRRGSKLPHNLRIYLFQRVADNVICLKYSSSDDFSITCKRNIDEDVTKQRNQSFQEEQEQQEENDQHEIYKSPMDIASSSSLFVNKRITSSIENLDGSNAKKKSKNDKEQDVDLFIDKDDGDISDESENPFPIIQQTRPHFFVTLLRALYSDISLGGDNFKPEKDEDVIPQVADTIKFQRSMKNSPGLQKFTTILLGEVLSGKDADFYQIYADSDGGESDNDIIGSNSAIDDGSSCSLKRNKSNIEHSANIARDLSNYLQNDDTFTKNLAEFVKSCSNVENKDSNIEEYVSRFFSIVVKHVEGFLTSREISFNSLEERLSLGSPLADVPNMKNEAKIRSPKQAQTMKAEFLKRVKQNPFADVFDGDTPRLTESEFDLEGTWIYIGDERAADQVVNALNARGFPGFLLHFVRKSMVKFHVNVNKNWLYLKAPGELAKDLQYLFALDGKEHSWILPQLVSLTSPIRSIKYTGCVDYESKCIRVEQYGLYLASKEQILCICHEFSASLDGIEVYDNVSYYIGNETTRKKEYIGEIKNTYLRIWRNEDSSKLL